MIFGERKAIIQSAVRPPKGDHSPVKKLDDLPYSHAGLGLARPAWGFARTGGREDGEMPHACPACNREDGRRTASQALAVELPLEQEVSQDGQAAKVIARLVIDYCPCCGRIYDVRCAAKRVLNTT